MDIINKNIKFIRTHHRLTQAEFAERLQTTRDNISKYEGKSIPKPDFLRLLSEKFEVNIHSLFLTEMTDSNYHLFILSQDTLSGNLDISSDFKDFEKITAKDVRLFDSLIKEKIIMLYKKELNAVDRTRIGEDLLKYEDILIRKLIEFYNKQSQLFKYLSDKGILP